MKFIIKVSKELPRGEKETYDKYDDIYVQTVEELNLQAIINAVNPQTKKSNS